MSRNYSTLSSALSLVALGWPVFPLAPGAKVPLFGNPHPRGSEERRTCRGECGAWGHGVLDATTDRDTVESWWSRTVRANIGIATGHPGPDVVDVDVKGGSPGAATFARVRDAKLLVGAFAVVTTASSGWHLYFAGTGQANGTRARHGLDFRSKGGYVVSPPSMVGGRRYELAEYRDPTGETVNWTAIRNFLDPPRPPRDPSATAPGDFAGLVRWLEARPAGDRNAALFWAVRRAAEQDADAHVIDELRDAIVRAGHNPRDAERTVDSAARGTGATR